MNNTFTINNPMPPEWLMYPQFSQTCLGWRMGSGERYVKDLSNWLKTLTAEEKEIYNKMFPRPSFWHNVAARNNPYEFYYKNVDFWRKKGEMKYSRSKLVEHPGLTSPGYIFFWKPSAGVIDQSCLSQWQPSYFDVCARSYQFAGQYMMAEKAKFFEDRSIEEKIIQSSDPEEMKALDKKIKSFRSIWDKIKYSIVLNGNYYKFAQDEALRNFLLATGDKILVEASPLDAIWGIGLAENDTNANNPSTWRGQNLLGFALMEVRDELRMLYKNYNTIDWESLRKIYG